MAVEAIGQKQGRFTVHNFEVEDWHSYFVGRERLLAHNSCELGIAREIEVAKILGGKRARDGSRDLKVFTKSGNGIRIDVIGGQGELVLVGGPAKAGSLGELGDRMKTLKEAATDRGVTALAFFEEGTPQSAIDIARRWLGDANVQIFPKVQ